MGHALDTQIPVLFLAESFEFGDDGVFWRERPTYHFSSPEQARIWNDRWAGVQAFTTDNGAGYKTSTITLHGKAFRLQLHRVVYALHYRKWPKEHVDHIDGNKDNNDPSNLRDVTNSQNSRNARLSTANTSGRTGVYWFKPRQCWTAAIGHQGRNINLGYYHSQDLATAARIGAEKALGYDPKHGKKRT